QDEGTQRMTDQARLVDALDVEQGLQILDPAVDRQRPFVRGAAGALEVIAQHREAIGERAHLRFPDVGRAAQPMDEHHGIAAALLLDSELLASDFYPHRFVLRKSELANIAGPAARGPAFATVCVGRDSRTPAMSLRGGRRPQPARRSSRQGSGASTARRGRRCVAYLGCQNKLLGSTFFGVMPASNSSSCVACDLAVL